MRNRHTSSKFRFFPRITFVLIAGLMLSCSRTASKESNADPAASRLEKAYALIDSDREDEAIELLRASLAETLSVGRHGEEFKAALASAYVKRAGLPAQSFYSFARTWMETENTDDFSFVPRASSDANGEEPKTALELFETYGLQSLAFILQIKSRFDRLPDLEAEQDLELQKAVEVLATISEPSRGVALYRALLQTVRFKYRLKGGLYFQTGSHSTGSAAPSAGASTDPVACLSEKSAFVAGLESLASDVDSILSDLKLAFPSQEASMSSAQRGVREARLELAKLKTQALAQSGLGGFEWQEVSRFVRRQFGWEWSCL